MFVSMKTSILREAMMFNLTAILGPVFFLGGSGWLLDKYFGTNKTFLFVAIAIAFAVTNFLMFKKIMHFMKVSNEHIKAADRKEAEELKTGQEVEE